MPKYVSYCSCPIAPWNFNPSGSFNFFTSVGETLQELFVTIFGIMQLTEVAAETGATGFWLLAFSWKTQANHRFFRISKMPTHSSTTNFCQLHNPNYFASTCIAYGLFSSPAPVKPETGPFKRPNGKFCFDRHRQRVVAVALAHLNLQNCQPALHKPNWAG
jgi:hypothetical protein